MRFLTRKRLLTALACVGALAAAVLVTGPGYEAAQVQMRTGTVWLASSQTGEATLVDGASAEVRAHVKVSAANRGLSVVQRGNTAVVLNLETGELSNVDSATERVSPPVNVLPASEGLIVLPGQDALYVADVHNGQVASVDPTSLTTRHEPERLADAFKPENVVVDGRGTVWAVDDATGDLVWLNNGERGKRGTAGKGVRLAVTDGKPALVDAETGTAELLNPETGNVARSVRLDLPGDAVAVGGSADQARVLIATSQGELSSCAFDSGCTAPVLVGSAGAALGTPVEVDNHAVVPDYSTGQVTIVDLATSRVVAQRQLFDKPTRFELITRDGIVFFNDPRGNAAGVLDLSGDTRTITKHTRAEDGTAPVPDRSTKTDQVAKTGQHKPGLGLPTPNDLPFQPNPPAPVPAASIVVKPGNHGVVGDVFELTMKLQSPGDTTARWSFGDGSEATGTTVRHSWREPGVFTVRATASLSGGKQVRAETAVTVDPAQAPPRIAALNVRPAKPVIGQQVRFTADTTGSAEKWAWSITAPGNPIAAVTAQTPGFVHAFTTPGTYTVSLTTTAGNGQTAHSSTQLTVSRGAVKIWGDADEFNLDDVPEEASSGVVAIDATAQHCVALRSDGRVVSWGAPDDGRATVPSNALSGVVAIAAGGAHSLALKSDGSVITWGAQLDDLQIVPEAAKHDVVAIAGGSLFSLALRSDGRVVAWGDDLAGTTTVPDAATSGVIAIAAGINHALALKSDGSVINWGYSSWTNLEVPDAAKSGVVAIAAGDDRSLAVKADGSIIEWGMIWESERPMPPAARNGVVSIDLSSHHVLALKADGSVLGWGADLAGETSLPAEYDRSVTTVAAGPGYSLAVVDDAG
ncbi:PKD domain-containing protein [Lentzea sp. NPDC051838]|uniref:PKD domain-containing protein n=1 Tax=Lentzea sp. NPDC051838 TaxID=3154849 RepID=UPI00341F5B78